MEEGNIAIRLKGFIQSQGLTNSEFADKCGIARPSLSQLLGGRNKKISDVLVGQIHAAYPELSVLWLMFGEGSMMISNQQSPLSGEGAQDSISGDGVAIGVNGVSETKNGSDDSVNLADGRNVVDRPNVKALTPAGNIAKSTENQGVDYEYKTIELMHQIDKMKKNPRKVSQITVYYDDSTFETFYPKR